MIYERNDGKLVAQCDKCGVAFLDPVIDEGVNIEDLIDTRHVCYECDQKEANQ